LTKSLTKALSSKDYLIVKLQSVLAEGSLPKIVEYFKRAVDVGAFEKQLALFSFLCDIARNSLSVAKHNGDGRGKRFQPSTIALFEVLQNFGGLLAHNFVSKNLVGPSLNTTCCNFCKEGFIYSIGINEANFLHIADVLLSVKKSLNIT
jgi:hypothetical protein